LDRFNRLVTMCGHGATVPRPAVTYEAISARSSRAALVLVRHSVVGSHLSSAPASQLGAP
jgi:hypothetical protein